MLIFSTFLSPEHHEFLINFMPAFQNTRNSSSKKEKLCKSPNGEHLKKITFHKKINIHNDAGYVSREPWP